MDCYLRRARRRVMKAAGTDPASARDEAFLLRMENDLCLHSDDERVYQSAEARDQDEKPATVCDECGKERLIVRILADGPVGADVEALIVKNYLR